MPWTWNQAITPLTSNPNVNDIINPNAVTYNYELPSQNYITFSFDPSQATGAATNATALSSLQQQCVRNALNYVHSVTGINFMEIPAGPPQPQELVFVNASNTGIDVNGNTAPEGVFTEYPAAATDAGGNFTFLDIKNTIAFSTQYDYMNNLQAGGRGYEQLLQGIGQALGLKTPDLGALAAGLDTTASTLMSENYTGTAYTAYQPMDIEALNWLYGGDGILGQYGLSLNANAVPVANGGPPGGMTVGSAPYGNSPLLAQTA
jgi:hypothetical protein